MNSFAQAANTADIIAKKCRLYASPADIVARNAKEGNGTNGMSERKKLTNARPTYPTWGENGSSVVTSITCEHACQLFNHGRHEFGGC